MDLARQDKARGEQTVDAGRIWRSGPVETVPLRTWTYDCWSLGDGPLWVCLAGVVSSRGWSLWWVVTLVGGCAVSDGLELDGADLNQPEPALHRGLAVVVVRMTPVASSLMRTRVPGPMSFGDI